MATNLLLWLTFGAAVIVMSVLDLGVFHRRAHVMTIKEATIWTGVWVALAVAFGTTTYITKSSEAGLQFFSGYLIEEALSADNLFVFVVIFSYFQVSRQYQHRVLFLGIVGAFLMRGIFILVGVTMIRRFAWVMYGFGAFLILTGLRLVARKDEEHDLRENTVVRLARHFLPLTDSYAGQAFFVRRAGRLLATPLLLVLLVVETTDVLFATDSIPAVFAISRDPFVIYTSNVFAILSLRALYFLVAGLMQRLCYLSYGLSTILVFVGAKMLLHDVYEIPTLLSLVFIVSVLTIVVITSLVSERRNAAQQTVEGKEAEQPWMAQ
jgi:tellurite resistance protein TerC